MQKTIGVGISLPREIMQQIDSERGDISRSRFLLRMIESVKLEKNGNDPLDVGCGTPVSSESTRT
jgi:hypothetical protein